MPTGLCGVANARSRETGQLAGVPKWDLRFRGRPPPPGANASTGSGDGRSTAGHAPDHTPGAGAFCERHPGRDHHGDTTKTMLEDAERRVAALEQAARDVGRHPAPVVPVKSVVIAYLTTPRETLGTNVDEAHRLLTRALDNIVLQRDGRRLVAEITRNFAGILQVEETVFGSIGAGRASRIVPYHRVQVSWLPPANIRHRSQSYRACDARP